MRPAPLSIYAPGPTLRLARNRAVIGMHRLSAICFTARPGLISDALVSSRARWLQVAVAAALAVQSPAPAAAAPASGISQEAQDAYDRGLAERDAGHHAAAAREFASAYSQISGDQRELRAAVLFDLVEAHRSAFAAGGARRGNEHPAAHLCAADRALAEFIEAEASRKKGKKTADATKAAGLREQVKKEFTAAKAKEADLDCAALELPRVGSDKPVVDDGPEPEPADGSREPQPKPVRDPKKLLIAGGVSAGAGLLLLGLMVGGMVRGDRAEADGEALVEEMPLLMSGDPQFDDIERRGRSGNAMAIVGGVLGSLALGAGVALLVVGARASKQRRDVAVWPVLSPQSAGAGLRWRF